jgi:maltose alpha-D-glucosyltransferase/alpha-amylase
MEIGPMASRERKNPLPLQIHGALPRVLPEFLIHQRWFSGKARSIQSVEIVESVPIPMDRDRAFLVLGRVGYSEGQSDTYAVPLILARSGQVPSAPAGDRAIPTLRLERQGRRTGRILYDALWDKRFGLALLEAIYGGKALQGTTGEVVAFPTETFHKAWHPGQSALEPSVMRAEQSNTSLRFGDEFILKFYRRLEEGINPDLEIGAFLTDKASFAHTPFLGGALEYRRPQAPPMTLGILQAFVPNQGDAWQYTLAELRSYMERIASLHPGTAESLLACASSQEPGDAEAPSDVQDLMGAYWDAAGLLGRRTAELHLALASGSDDPDFSPEGFAAPFQRAQYDSMRSLTVHSLRLLENRLPSLPESVRPEAEALLSREAEILGRFEPFVTQEIKAERIRIHGDYHLGQVLWTGSDFVIIDFEGEPARSLAERRTKRCALQDVAGMLRSFHYAAYTVLFERMSGEISGQEKGKHLEDGARGWHWWASIRFLDEYLHVAGKAPFLPQGRRELSALLNAYLLEKAAYELAYELNNRPDWVRLPLRGIIEILEPGH